MLELLYSTLRYSFYILLGMSALALAFSFIRALLRQSGLELVIAIRPLTDPGRYPVDWHRRRLVVLRRDGFTCRNCGADGELHVHHIVPLSAGGTNNWSNLVTLCRRCHRRLHPDMKDFN